jgi:hypothetical protein
MLKCPDFYNRFNVNYSVALLYSMIGDTQMAMVYLVKSWEAEESDLPGIKFDSDLALLRDHTRFKAMLKEMGLKGFSISGENRYCKVSFLNSSSS